MAQPGNVEPMSAPAPAVSVRRRGRGPIYLTVVVVGLVAGFALGWGGVALGGDRAVTDEHRFVEGTCRAFANFQDGGMTWADEDVRLEASLTDHHLWYATVLYARAAVAADPTFDFASHTTVEKVVDELPSLDFEALVQTEASLARLCAAREL